MITNVLLWAAAAVLVFALAAGGALKLVLPKDKYVALGQDWARAFRPAALWCIGVAELIGALGLIVPLLAHTAPLVVALTATGVALLIGGLTVTHAALRQRPYIRNNLLLITLAVVVAAAQFAPFAVTA